MTLRGVSRAVVTGASSGLGRATALSFAAKGLAVALVVRDVGRGERVAEQIRAARPGAEVSVVLVDLADLDTVRTGAATLAESGPIDILVNNAGLSAIGRRRLTRQGHELQMGVNHLGHFALTALLMPVLRRAPRPRVVSVSSLAYRSAGLLDPRLGAGEDFRGWRGYAQSKLACGLFGLELDRRAREAGLALISTVAHPGWSATHLFGDRGQALARLARGIASTPEHGARSQVRAALDPALRGGEFLGPRLLIKGPPALLTPGPNMRDRDSARILWELSEERTGIRFDVG